MFTVVQLLLYCTNTPTHSLLVVFMTTSPHSQTLQRYSTPVERKLPQAAAKFPREFSTVKESESGTNNHSILEKAEVCVSNSKQQGIKKCSTFKGSLKF